MHQEVEQFVSEIKIFFPKKFSDQHVLDCGSLDINGSLKKFFQGGTYYGIDIATGPGVDQNISIENYLKRGDKLFDVIVSSESLEHDRDWRTSWRHIISSLRPGGLVIMTCAGPDRAEHGTVGHGPNLSPATNDYYQNRELSDFRIPDKNTFKLSRYVRGKKDINLAFKL